MLFTAATVLSTLALSNVGLAAPANPASNIARDGAPFPRLDATFFTDSACGADKSPATEKALLLSQSCDYDSSANYLSMMVHIAPEALKNKGLKLGVAHSDNGKCGDFSKGEKFNIDESVGKCLYIGLPRPHKPDQGVDKVRLWYA
jgi:hypothetical protein